MTAPENKEPIKKSDYDGLSDEIKKVIRDEQFQATVGKFVSKSDTPFKVIKGIGFAIAVASGLFGYLLAANSEADDRRAQMIHKVINEKQDWMQRVNNAILELRRTRTQIKYDCENNKPISLYEQGLKRFDSRADLVKSFNGIGEVFNDEVFKTLLELTSLDESVKDVCAKDAPDDNAWLDISRKLNRQMRESLKIDREHLKNISTGLFEGPFQRL